MRFVSTMIFSLALLGIAIGDEGITPEDPKLGRPVDFYQDLYPILENKCLACHSSAVAESDLILESAKTILKGGASGDTVIPGKPDDSYLYQVSARIEESFMPPLPNKVQAKAMTPLEVGILRQWILEGAKGGTRVIDNSIAWQPISESYKAVYSLALGPDRRFIYAGRGNRIFVYDLISGDEIARLGDPALMSLEADGQTIYGSGVAHRDFVHSLALSSDGKKIASGGYRVVKIWERQAPLELAEIKLDDEISKVAVNADGTMAALLRADHQIQIWNLTTGQPGSVIPNDGQAISAITFGPNSEKVIAATSEGKLRISQLEDGATSEGAMIAGNVSQLSSLADGEFLITAGQDNVIRMWNWKDVKQLVGEGSNAIKPVHELKGHSNAITTLSVLQEKKEVVSGSDDGTVRIWSLADGKELFSQNLDGAVIDVTVSSDGQIVAATGKNKLTRLWSRDGKKIADVTGNQQLKRLHEKATENETVGKSELSLADSALKEAEKDLAQREESLKKAKEQKDKVTKELAEAETKVTEAKSKVDEAVKKLAEKADDEGLKKAKDEADKAFTANEDARNKKKDELKSADRAIELSEQSIEIAKKNVDDRKATKAAKEARQKQFDEAVTAAKAALDEASLEFASVAMTTDANRVLTVGNQQPVQSWNSKTGRPTGVVDLPLESVQTAELIESGALLTIESGGLARLWDLTPRWKLTWQLGVDAGNPLDVTKSTFEDRVTALAFHPGGELLATGGGEPSRNGELLIWNSTSGELVNKIEDAHSDSITDLEFSRDGSLLVTGATDKFVKLFRVEDGSLVRSYEGHTDHVLGVAIKADSSRLASSGADMAIKIWNTETGEQTRTITNYGKQVTSIDFVGVSDNLISGSGDQNVKFHTASNGRNFRSFSGSTDFVYHALATGDEELVIAAGEDGVIRVWNGKDGKLLKSFAPPEPETETAQR